MRGGGRQPLVLNEALHVSAENAEHLLELDAALERLEALDPELSEVVQLRFFAGLSHEELATHLEVSVRTVERRSLRFARRSSRRAWSSTVSRNACSAGYARASPALPPPPALGVGEPRAYKHRA